MRFGPEVLNADLYGVLDVGPSATTDEIRRAYRRLAARHHPDRNRCDPWAERRMALINVAAGVLLNAERRALYDRLRASGATRYPPMAPRPAAVPFGSRDAHEWVEPPKARRRRAVSREVSQLLSRLRTRPERWMSAVDVELRSWSGRRHGVVLAACAVLAFGLVGCARPRSITKLFAPEPTARAAVR